MSDIPNHLSPPYSEGSREDALFHYTTAKGLIGILSTGQIWSTAYYCANDESELATGKGVLTPLFRNHTYRLIEENDPRVSTFARRGVDVLEYADHFENQIASMALSSLCAYITCFCKPTGEEDFRHGLLSQWRGYAADGGYALQFSRKKLLATIANIHQCDDLNYDLLDVHYHVENPLKAEVLRYADAFVQAYAGYLDELAQPIDFTKKTMRSPIAGLPGGPLEAYLNYWFTPRASTSPKSESADSVLFSLPPWLPNHSRFLTTSVAACRYRIPKPRVHASMCSTASSGSLLALALAWGRASGRLRIRSTGAGSPVLPGS